MPRPWSASRAPWNGAPEPTASDRWLWCSASRRSHAVVVIDAAKLPAVMRAKLEMPDAEGMRSAGIPSSEIVIIARKKVLIATPCTSRAA